MNYKIKKEKIKELKEGKSNVHISKITGYSRQYLSRLFNSKEHFTEKTVLNVLSSLAIESNRINTMLIKNGMEETIKYFFEEIK